MLSDADNKRLCDVSPGSPMSEAFKHYWLPVMKDSRLEAGGAPVKFTALCEDYVAFRAEDGRVAVFAEKCPHRGCSLALAQNEDCALTCLFHGWKFDVSGQCVATPNMPDPEFPAKVPLKYYPSREAGGVLWVYLGDGEPARFPEFVFNRAEPEQYVSRAAIVNYNWLTGLDAILDPSHVGSLHQNWIENAPGDSVSADIKFQAKDTAPTLEIEPTDWGFRYAAMREAGEGKRYLRVTEHVQPSGCFIAQSIETRKLFIMSMPIDNTHSIQWYIWYNPKGPLVENDLRYALGNTDRDDNNFYQTPKDKPLWGQDREAMKNGTSFTGFTDIMFEDFIVGESQGAIPDRSQEHLCAADSAIARARRILLQKLKRYQEGDQEAFSHGNKFEYGALQSLGAIIDTDTDWRAIAKLQMSERAEKLNKLS
jgi:phthalate 4,5-dioxygenase